MKPKQIAILVVIALFVTILLQNMDGVALELLFWSIYVPKLILIIAAIFLGFVTGWFAKLGFRRGKAAQVKMAATETDQITEGTVDNQPVSHAQPSTKAGSQ
jgi:uncharacterized integral membrane protein